MDEQDDEHKRQAVSRAKKTVAQKARALGCERLLTLTTRENIESLDTFWSLWKAFLQRCARAGIEFKYVAVPERQKRGAWHVHVGIDRFVPQNLLLREWLSVCDSGTVNIQAFKNLNLQCTGDRSIIISAYLAKYIGKEMGSTEFGRKRYRASSGIEIEREVIYIPRALGSFPDDLFKSVTGYEAHSYRLNDYGVQWLASWGEVKKEPRDGI